MPSSTPFELFKLSITPQPESLVVPARPTEHQIIPLSNLDYYVPDMTPTLYVYQASRSSYGHGHGHNAKHPATIIRDSLAELLVSYYPAAGRVRQNPENGRLEIHCLEQGCVFVEAYADHDISEIGEWSECLGPSWSELVPDIKSFPGAEQFGTVEAPIMFVQVTEFRTGGFTMGMYMNHLVFDGAASGKLLECWTKIARGVPKFVPTPIFDKTWLAPRSPPKPEYAHLECFPLPDISNLEVRLKQGEFEYGIFSFGVQELEKLRQIAMQDGGESLFHKCTSFEALTAHVWRARTKAMGVKNAQMVKFLFSNSGRSQIRNEEVKAEDYVGNIVLYPAVISRADLLIKKPLSYAVRLIQRAKMSVTEEYIRSAIDHFEITHSIPTYDVTTFNVFQWTWLGLQEASDFGWGCPIYAGPLKLPPTVKELGSFILTDGSRTKGNQCHHLLLGLPKYAMDAFREFVRL